MIVFHGGLPATNTSDRLTSRFGPGWGIHVPQSLALIACVLGLSALQCGVHRPIPHAGLLLWLKSDAGVTLNGSHVSRWADQSGNGNDAIQLDAPRQPLLVNGELNGKPAIHFDGKDDWLGLTGSKHMTGICLFIVFEMDSGFGGDPVVFGDIDADGRIWGIDLQSIYSGFSSDTVNVYTGLNSRAQFFSPQCAASGRWHSYSVVTDGAIWSTTFRGDGGEGQMSPDGNNMFIDVPLGNSLGTGVGGIGGTNWSRPGFGRSAVKFEIAELLVYDSVLPDSTRRGVEKYLGDKYQLSPSLRDGK